MTDQEQNELEEPQEIEPMSGNQQDQISIAAEKAWQIENLIGPLMKVEARFKGTTKKVLKINGVEITQELLDTVPLFKQNGLTIQEVIDGVLVLIAIKTLAVDSQLVLGELAKAK